MGFKEELYSLTNLTVNENEPMSKHTGYSLGGNADYFVTPYTVKCLSQILSLCTEHGVKYKFIGNGTNLLFSDKGFRGVVITLKGFNSLYYNNGRVYAYCGVNLCELTLFSAEYGLYGAEPLVGIPATVGGATVMNAGAFDRCISDFIDGVLTIKDGKYQWYSRGECKFGYRKSRFLNSKDPIISVVFSFKKSLGNISDYKQIIERCNNARKTNQPKGKSCGCVFKNPKGDYAGRLIDSLGLKGLTYGGASVSEKHANFILAQKGCTASDIYNLTQIIKEKVKNRLGINLTEEIEFLGEF